MELEPSQAVSSRGGLGCRLRRWLPLGSAPMAALGCGLVSLTGGVATAAAAEAEVPAVGSAARGPGLGSYSGICLGNCFDCHSLLEALPRWPRLAAATSHTDPSRFSVEELEAFLSAPEVCDVRDLFPVSVDREIWSLASLKGGAPQLRFPGARQQVKATSDRCSAMLALAADAFAEARRSAAACSVGAPGDGGARCRGEASRRAAAGLLGRWHATFGHAAPGATAAGRQSTDSAVEEEFVIEVDFGATANETGDFLQAFAARVEGLFVERGQLPPLGDESTTASSLGGLVSLPLGEKASGALLGLSLELAKAARLLIEHVRTIWGLRDLMMELSSVYPQIRAQLPMFRMHAGRYGRHWDVLEWLMHGLVAGSWQVSAEEASREAPLRMVELGVACGPIGYHLLPRFPSLSYFGADPTIPATVREAYSMYADRASLFANTSEELHSILEGTEPLDFVFIDGPHTYKNVANDLQLWAPRMRPGGIIAGHDFTCAHPPLLWAVTEFRIQTGGEVNLGMDGVWWWRAQ
mmetsp:Transcript_43013/g.121618  ORF Transcript_43013/g.121618 Transcript_43013/m.121618 type:complete len:525 (+) Transcript_43013:69-1643(+)